MPAVGCLLWCSAAAQLIACGTTNERGGYDQTRYVLLAESLVATPTFTLPRTTQYPLGWPLVMSTIMRFGGGLVGIHLLNKLLTLAASVILVLYLRRRREVSCGTATAFGAVFLSSRWTWYMADSLWAEPLFIVGVLCLLYVADASGRPRSQSLKKLFLVGLLIALLRVVRTVGIAFAAAAVVQCLFLDRDQSVRSRLRSTLAVMVPVVLMEIGLGVFYPVSSFLFGNAYVGQFEDQEWIPQITQHFKMLASSCIPMSVTLWHPRFLFQACGAVLGVIGLACLIRDCLQKRNIASSLVCAYLLMIVMWPYHSPRFFWPVAMYVLFMALHGITGVAARLGRRSVEDSDGAIQRAGTGSVLFLAAISVLAVAADRPLHREVFANRERAFVEALNFIDDTSDTPVAVGTYHCFRVFWHRRHWQIIPFRVRNDWQTADSTEIELVLCENEKLDLESWQERGWLLMYDNGRVSVLRR